MGQPPPLGVLPADAPTPLVIDNLVGTYERVRELLRLLLARGGREPSEQALLQTQLNDAMRSIAQLHSLAPTSTPGLPPPGTGGGASG